MDLNEPQAPLDIEALFVELLRRHLHDAMWPMMATIDRLVAQLAEQLDARERLARPRAARHGHDANQLR
jgi:hypothetical protein